MKNEFGLTLPAYCLGCKNSFDDRLIKHISCSLDLFPDVINSFIPTTVFRCINFVIKEKQNEYKN